LLFTRLMKSRLLNTLLLFAFFVVPAGAWAQASEFQAAGLAVPQKLMRDGYETFGYLSLSELTAVIQATPVRWATGKQIGIRNSSGRISGRWEMNGSQRTILVNQETWEKFPEDQSIFALHEYLGIAGFQDGNYWLSTSLWFLSLDQARAALDSNQRATVAGRISGYARTRLASGTIIGVGGGGNILTLHLRAKRLREDLRDGRIEDIDGDLQSRLDTNFYYKETQTKPSKTKAKKLPPVCSTPNVECPLRKVLPGNVCVCKEDPANTGDVLYPY
jgi:hypothetical protein